MKDKTRNTLLMTGMVATQDKSPLASFLALLAMLTGAMLAGGTARADVIFTEPFSINASGWAANSAGTPATWATTGGVTGDSDGYITAAAVTTSSGAVVLRAQTNLGSSPGLFGNWTSTGTSPLSVYSLSFDLYQDSSTTQNFGLRFTTSAGFPGAFSASDISLGSGVWTHFDVPINSTAFTFPEGGGTYDSTFSALARMQVTASGTPASTFNVRLDNVTISTAPAPEPSTLALAGFGLAAFGVMARRMKRNT